MLHHMTVAIPILSYKHVITFVTWLQFFIINVLQPIALLSLHNFTEHVELVVYYVVGNFGWVKVWQITNLLVFRGFLIVLVNWWVHVPYMCH